MKNSRRWIPTSGRSRETALIALAATLLSTGGCLYSFQGGGLPGHIRTVAILPFDNETPEPVLTQEVTQAVTEAMEQRLGLRPAGEATADALVRGTIRRYEPDIPLSFEAGDRGDVQVTRRRIQLTLSIEIIDQREDRTLWERSGLVVDGEYEPPDEVEGRRVALEKLVADIVDGAQSQW